MNAKTLSILAIITSAVVVAAVLLTQPQTATTKKGNFFPDLQSVLNDVTEISVSRKDETVTLIRSDGQWLLKEKHSYPVELDKVYKLLLGAADLTILEAKTSKPALYSKIGVEDVSEEGAKSTLLTFKKTEGETVASLIVGHDRTAKIDSTRQEIYVRKPDEKQTWLTLGQLPIEKDLADWLDPEIVNIDSDNIRQVSITHPDGEHFLILKNTPKDEDYQMADLPKNAKVKSAYVLNQITATLNRLNLDDVAVASDFVFDDNTSNSAVFTTFDGLEVAMTTMEKEGKHYAKFAAAFNPDAVYVEPPKKDEDETASEGEESQPENEADENAEKAEEKPKVDAKKQADTLNAKFKGWVYELSKYKVDDLEKRREDFIEVEEPPAAEEPDEQSPTMELKGSDDLPVPFTMPDFRENLLTPFGTPSTATETPMLPFTGE
ncbi:MAG: hypothetical protein DRR19_12760 [Candidatus Parabeggiatoa sp. nov. 1]|nr:MAG: hypothetical protein DRR19_12760 [Gammaproteobacteria bacterium]